MTNNQQVWWDRWNGPTLRQGQVLPQCLIIEIPESYAHADLPEDEIPRRRGDVIVLTQTCDLVPQPDRRGGTRPPRAHSVAVCPVFGFARFVEANRELERARNEIRLGRRAGFYLLGSPTSADRNDDCLIADFHNIYSLPRAYLEIQAEVHAPCLALKPPCLEHFSQALGHFFMRVGLSDEATIPPFA